MSAKKRLTTSAAAAAACMLLAQTAPANAAQTVQNPAGLRGGIVADGTGRGGGGDDSPSPARSDGAAVEPGAGGPFLPAPQSIANSPVSTKTSGYLGGLNLLLFTKQNGLSARDGPL